MSNTTTILHEYERRLDDRLRRGEIAESTHDAYLNEASRIFEVLLRHIPANVIEGYMQADGYRGYYGHIVDALRALARSRRQAAFPDVRRSQPTLPGV